MLNRIATFFREHLAPADGRPEDRAHGLRLAAAALLLEVVYLDDEVTTDEQAVVLAAIRSHFGLSAAEAAELLACAEQERTDSTDYFQFTSLINRHYTAAQKVELVELMWRIAYADDALHHYEEHLVRKVAELLYVPHRDFIAAKHRAGGHG